MLGLFKEVVNVGGLPSGKGRTLIRSSSAVSIEDLGLRINIQDSGSNLTTTSVGAAATTGLWLWQDRFLDTH